jgi:hypothetical protein
MKSYASYKQPDMNEVTEEFDGIKRDYRLIINPQWVLFLHAECASTYGTAARHAAILQNTESPTVLFPVAMVSKKKDRDKKSVVTTIAKEQLEPTTDVLPIFDMLNLQEKSKVSQRNTRMPQLRDQTELDGVVTCQYGRKNDTPRKVTLYARTPCRRVMKYQISQLCQIWIV